MRSYRHSVPRLLAAALCVSCASMTAQAQDVHEEIFAPKVQPSSRLLRRRRDHATHRRLEYEDDDGMDISFGSEEESSESPCKSIIVVGGTRRFDASSTRSLQDSDSEDDDDADLSYDDADDDEDDDDDNDIEFVCELQDRETTVPIVGTREQMKELRGMVSRGEIVSAESTVKVEQGRQSDEYFLQAPGAGSNNLQTVALPSGPIEVVDNDHDLDIHQRRLSRHNMYDGVKQVLAVRVTDAAGRVVPQTAEHISNKLFGTYGDKVTLASGFEGCSFGRMTITSDYGGYIDESVLSAPGVLDVIIPVRLDQSDQGTILAHARHEVHKKLGVPLPYIFDHVTFMLAECFEIGTECKFVAYAYSNHWLSVFLDDNYKYPAVMMHEYGHNLNLAHSGGLDGNSYSDHTCLMGDPLWDDDLGKMCFNPVKNFQIARNGASRGGRGWYENRHVMAFNSGTQGGTNWSGRIIGPAQYGNNSNDDAVVLKLEAGNGNDWFLGFNRVVGPNSDNRQANDRVTIYKVLGGNGLTFAKSSFKGSLGEGRTATLKNWRKSGWNLVITVHEINTLASPGYAEVEVAFGDQPTAMPTYSPSTAPSSQPSLSPTATGKPSLLPSNAPSLTAAPSNQPSSGPSRSSSPSLQPSANPSSSTAPSSQPSAQPSASSQPSQSPSASPSKAPSVQPSQNPTDTARPSLIPSDAPSLSSAPSSQPSSGPSRSSSPSSQPSANPSTSTAPSSQPSAKPSASSQPTVWHSSAPSDSPSGSPTATGIPTLQPSSPPSTSTAPTSQPSESPSTSARPSALPSPQPSISPTNAPSSTPSTAPSASPTLSSEPTAPPSMSPSVSAGPSNIPSHLPTLAPSASPTDYPTESPTAGPTISPTKKPTLSPSRSPTLLPSISVLPTIAHTENPSASGGPTLTGSHPPSMSVQPTQTPTRQPTSNPTDEPTRSPSHKPTQNPTRSPTTHPTASPTETPTDEPTMSPTNVPSSSPSSKPTGAPSDRPTTPAPTVPPTSPPTMSAIRSFDSGTTGGTSWSGDIISISHYNDNPTNRPVVVMLVSDDGSDWVVGFNGFQVTITKLSAGQNTLLGALVAGQSETITNWRNTGMNLAVFCTLIDTNASPSFASVEITFGAES